tara:strand:- start:1182 stop:3047 length:1866 start_codon:yes stop_codon:yes gene_type:complete
MSWTTGHSLTYFYIGIAQQSDTQIYDQELDCIKKILSVIFDNDEASIDQVVKESLNEYNKDLFNKGVGHCQQMYVACGESFAKHQVDNDLSPSLKNVFHDLIMNSVKLIKSDGVVFDTEKATVDVLIEYWDMNYDDEELESMWKDVTIIGWSEERLSQHTEKLQKEMIKPLFDVEVNNSTEKSEEVQKPVEENKETKNSNIEHLEQEKEDIPEKNFEKYYDHKEPYNHLIYPQGDYPKMSYDFVDSAIVMMCFLADTNGDGINQDEQHEIMRLAKLLYSSYLIGSISSQDGNLKMNEAIDWYYAISDKFPETNDYANEALWSKMRWFKDQDWFDNTLAQTLLDAFVKLAKNSNAGATNYEINRIYVVASWWKESKVVVKNLHYINSACDKDQLSKDDIEWTKDKNIKHLVEYANSEIDSLQSSKEQSEGANEGSEKSDPVSMSGYSLRNSKLTFDDYINAYKEEHPKEDQDEDLLRATVDFLYEAVQGEDGLLEIFSRTGGYSTYANNKLKNGKFAQVRWSKSDRKEGKPRQYFVDLTLLKSRMNYKIESLPDQSLQSPHADEFYVIRLYSQDNLWNNEDLLKNLIKDSFKSRQKNKLITKRKNFTKKELKKEYLKDIGVL